MKPLHFLGLLTAAFILCAAMAVKLAFADECISPEQSAATTMSHYPAAQIAEVPTAETQGFIKAYNAYPPKSAIDGDTMQVIEIPGFPKLVVYFFKAVCGVWTLPISQENFIKFMIDGNGNPT